MLIFQSIAAFNPRARYQGHHRKRGPSRCDRCEIGRLSRPTYTATDRAVVSGIGRRHNTGLWWSRRGSRDVIERRSAMARELGREQEGRTRRASQDWLAYPRLSGPKSWQPRNAPTVGMFQKRVTLGLLLCRPDGATIMMATPREQREYRGLCRWSDGRCCWFELDGHAGSTHSIIYQMRRYR